MNHYVTGVTIKELREKKGMTQKELAEHLCVSAKTVSKWETMRGLPDIMMLEPLAEALGISVVELLSGDYITNENAGGNMLRSKFYVCPVCGNVVHSLGEGLVSCCGITLPVLEAEDCDEEHDIKVERVENEYYVTLDHPMTKQHYISFLALITSDHMEMVKLYPEGNAETRFRMSGHGLVYAYCNVHGLFRIKQ